MKTLRRLARSGNSSHVVIERRLLDFMRWRPGDWLIVELTERGTLEVRPATGADLRAVSPAPIREGLPLEGVR